MGELGAWVHNNCIDDLYKDNDVHHLMGKRKGMKDLSDSQKALLAKYGSERAAVRALHKSAQKLVGTNYKRGEWVEIRVDGIKVKVKGIIIDGVFRVSSMQKWVTGQKP